MRGGNSNQYHPAKRLLKGIPDPLSLPNLTQFFKDAFLPNSDEIVQFSSFDEFVQIRENKNRYISTIYDMTDNRSEKEIYSILDLAAGEILLLKKILDQHGSHECYGVGCKDFETDFAKKVRYVAVDKKFPTELLDYLEPFNSKNNKCIQFSHHLLDLNNEDALDYLKYKYRDTPFDLIVLSNTLHEISPEALPNILSTIPDLLSEDGHFAFLDLTNPMTIDEINSSYKRFSTGKSFWEADAIYFDRSDIKVLIDQIGLNGIHGFGHDHDISYWHVKAKKKKDITSQQRKEATLSFLSEFLEKHLNNWKDTSKNERKEVKNKFGLSNDPYIFVFSALRYLCRCASDTRIRECLESISLLENITSLKKQGNDK